MSDSSPHSLVAREVPPRPVSTRYPEPFASQVRGRTKRVLGDRFGLRNFGVNLTTLNPGAISSVYHRHTLQDEFVYVVEGELVLVADGHETTLHAGMCAGFAAGVAHHLVNRSASPATYLEIGDRTPGDVASYPDDDLMFGQIDGQQVYTHRDGTPYP